MGAKDETPRPGNLLQEMLERARERYVEENGEEPPEEFIEEARELVLRDLASRGREEHRDVYDALAEE
jgi:hypothetical protein